MKTNTLPISLRDENYAIITKGDHAHIYPGELVKSATLEEMKAHQTPGKIVTFLTPSRLMQEAGRTAIGNEPILAIISDTKNIQYMTKEALQKVLKMHGDDTFTLGQPVPNISDELYVEKV